MLTVEPKNAKRNHQRGQSIVEISLITPLLLIATVVLSLGAALGASTLVFAHVFDFAAVEGSIPLLSFVFLVALGVDYNIFLMSRVHEESAQLGTRNRPP